MRSGNVILGVIAGAVAGAVVGMLVAPAKGSTTRKRIAQRGTEYAEDAKEKFNEYINALAEEYDTAKAGAMDWVEKGKERAVSVARAKHSK